LTLLKIQGQCYPLQNAYDFADVKIIPHILTAIQNKQVKIGWLPFSKEIQEFSCPSRSF
jgi:hypothetical protein